MCRVKSNCATWQNLEETNLYTSCDCFVKVVSISMFLLQLERQVVEESNVQQNIVSNSMPLFNHPPPPFMVPPMMMMRAPPPGMEFQPPLFRPPVQNPPLLTKPPGIDKPQVQCIVCQFVAMWLYTITYDWDSSSTALFQTEVAEVEQKEEPKGPRPKSNVPIPGSPWSVVWTTDERSFFFNVTSRTSVWSLPKDLEGNPHVSKIMDNPPWARSKMCSFIIINSTGNYSNLRVPT